MLIYKSNVSDIRFHIQERDDFGQELVREGVQQNHRGGRLGGIRDGISLASTCVKLSLTSNEEAAEDFIPAPATLNKSTLDGTTLKVETGVGRYYLLYIVEVW